MTPPLRILHLEDSEPDREFVSQALTGREIAFEFVYATNQAEFAAALESGKFALILSDFTMPGYDGMAALALAQEKCPDVPFLFVSGTIGEDRAIESLRSGATDYVLKERLERLLPAVRRALRESGERTRRHEAEERFRLMAETIRDVFWVTSPDGRELFYVSPACEQIWGRPVAELLADPTLWLQAVVAEDRPQVDAALAQLAAGSEYRLQYRIDRPDGSRRWIEDRGYPVRDPAGELKQALGVATDITARQELETQLLQAQKMEAIGQLAGGVAHDFNNVLTVVIGYARLLLDRETLPPDVVGPLTQIFTAGTRAANLTRQLLLFSRKQAVNRRAVDLNQIAGDIAEMLHRLIGEHIKLKLALSPDPCPAEADAGMIEQVLMNLAVNARDAMLDGGTLTVASEHVTIADPAGYRHPAARPGNFVCLSVRDTGCGIPPENLQRIFEPFFTTKEAGSGTGLGLATVFGIVQQHQGWIELESAVGVGTCFRILLPAVPQEAVVPARQPAKPTTVSGGTETILLVEDEAPVREFGVAVLRGHGYRVLQAGSGAEALEVWKWHGPRIALLLSDLVMPEGLGGVELAARLRQAKPTLKVVLTSGYAHGSTGEEFHPPAGTHFIHKPYRPQLLAQTVRDALDDVFNH